MYIYTNRPMEGEDGACFLYRGEGYESLGIRVHLKYADGRTRDVTFENTTNGRLILQGLDELSTDSVTTEDGVPQKFSAVYTLIRDNSNLANNPQETQGGAVINPMSLTITKEMKVYVLEDVFNNLKEVICAPYVETANNMSKIRAKYFGLYESGAIYDITNICTYVNVGGLQENGFGETQHITIRVPYGSAGQFRPYSFDILCFPDSKQVKVDNKLIRRIEANTQISQSFSGSFTKLGYLDSSNVFHEISIEALLALNASPDFSSKFDNVQPDYIQIRDVIDPTYIYTNIFNSIGSNGVGYTSTQGHELANYRPVLVEFIKININDDGSVSNIFKTNALLHYVLINHGA
jgi:hypothetical protein